MVFCTLFGFSNTPHQFIQMLATINEPTTNNQPTQRGTPKVPEHETVPCGPRIATFFFYLSDVEEAGGTHFPDIDLLVTPVKGRAVLWYVTETNREK